MRCLPAAEIINVGASLHVVKCRARPVLKNTRAALLEDPGFSRTEQSFATTEEQVHKHGEWELGALQSYMYFTTWIRSNPRNPGECPPILQWQEQSRNAFLLFAPPGKSAGSDEEEECEDIDTMFVTLAPQGDSTQRSVKGKKILNLGKAARG